MRPSSFAWILGAAVGVLVCATLLIQFKARDNEVSQSPEMGATSTRAAVTLESAQSATLRETEPANSVLHRRTIVEPRLAEIQIVDSTAGVVQGATVVACSGEELLWSMETDSRGTVRIAAEGREVLLIVSVVGMPLYCETTALMAGRHVIGVPAGERVAGVLLVANAGFAADLELTLESDAPQRSSTIPVSAWSALGVERDARLRVGQRTASDGSFVFSGLPRTWSGTLLFPRACRIESTSDGVISYASRRLRLPSPTEDLSIVVELIRMLRGRVLDATTRTPVPGVELHVSVGYHETGLQGSVALTTDDEGRFACSMGREDIEQLTLAVGGTSGANAFLQLVGREIPPDLDLGDVVLPELRDVRFTLHDEHGTAIAGGVATIDGVRSAPTNAAGRGVVSHVSAKERELRVVADGYVPQAIDLPDPLPDPLALALARANRVDVQLRAPGGGNFELFAVSLQCDAGLFHERTAKQPGRDTSVDHVVRPAASLHKEDPEVGVQVAVARPDADGIATFKALQPGHELVLRLAGYTGKPIYLERTLPPLAPCEERRVVVELDESWRSFHGRVVDENRNPIAGASVKLDEGCRVQADERGVFTMSCPLTSGTLRVSHAGFATLVREDFIVPEDGSAVELCMQPERRVVVTVVDANGEPVPEAEVLVESQNTGAATSPIGEGKFEVRGQSEQPFWIYTQVAGRQYKQFHDSGKTEARVVVPVHGKVVVEWTPPLEHEGQGWVVLMLRTTTKDRPDVVPLPVRANGQKRSVFPRVYPDMYELRCTYMPSDAERAGGAQNEELAVRVDVQVAAGVETVVSLPGR